MQVIAAAVLIAVGIVAAAVVYAIVNGRLHPARATSVITPPVVVQTSDTDISQRAAGVARREESVVHRESELE
ncbi:MAG: hypothetical protein LC749_17015, partial [Actinobacteria bacterium]|nr:hypothetical protein [Actinomycetota bacterium]